MDGIGNINWWGFSPSIDLLEPYEAQANNDDELKILLVSAGDQRHLIHTLANRKKHLNNNSNKKIHFFIYEKMLDLYARDILLLALALEHPSKRGLQEKTELFLEIFGNLTIRDYTAQIIRSKADDFIRYITDFAQLSQTNLKIFNFELLKFKERDFLESVFKFYRLKNDGKENFPAGKCWDLRLRSYFASRFDSRSNAYDWDFSMKLVDRKNAAVINNKLYARWRETGQAFELRDSNYNTPNLTLASSMLFNDPRNGDKSIRRGYFGDIVISPFIAFGVNSLNGEHFKKANELFKFNSVDISKENVSLYFKLITESSGIDLNEYQSLDEKLKMSKIVEVGDDEMVESNKTAESDYIYLDDCKITFLPMSSLDDFKLKEKYKNFFDCVYCANSGVAGMRSAIGKIVKENGLVFVDTVKFLIEMSNEQINSFSEQVRQIAAENCLVEISSETTETKSAASKANKEDETNKTKLETLDYLLFKSVKK